MSGISSVTLMLTWDYVVRTHTPIVWETLPGHNSLGLQDLAGKFRVTVGRERLPEQAASEGPDSSKAAVSFVLCIFSSQCPTTMCTFILVTYSSYTHFVA